MAGSNLLIFSVTSEEELREIGQLQKKAIQVITNYNLSELII